MGNGTKTVTVYMGITATGSNYQYFPSKHLMMSPIHLEPDSDIEVLYEIVQKLDTLGGVIIDSEYLSYAARKTLITNIKMYSATPRIHFKLILMLPPVNELIYCVEQEYYPNVYSFNYTTPVAAEGWDEIIVEDPTSNSVKQITDWLYGYHEDKIGNTSYDKWINQAYSYLLKIEEKTNPANKTWVSLPSYNRYVVPFIGAICVVPGLTLNVASLLCLYYLRELNEAINLMDKYMMLSTTHLIAPNGDTPVPVAEVGNALLQYANDCMRETSVVAEGQYD